MRILLTGGTGYLGGAMARRLAAAGHRLFCLVRDPRRAGELERLGAELAPGDVTDRESMRRPMERVDRVIHAAAVVGQEESAAAMDRVNREGTERVASLAHELGVGGLLHVSSVAAFGGSPPDGSPADEDSPPQLPLPTPYAVSKRAADLAVDAWEERGLAVDRIYPSLVYGPPGKPAGANAMLAGVARGSYPAIVAGDRITSWVFVDDVAEAVARMLDGPAAGRRYLLAGEAVRIEALVGMVAALAGRRPPRVRLPLPLARLGAALTAPLFRLVGRQPPLSPRQVRTVERHWHFDDRRARDELGWRPRPLDEGLPPTLGQWVPPP